MSFPSTHWSQIVASEDPASRTAALHCLARDYYQPVQRYVQRRWGKSPEDAQDLTQGFFLWIIESDFLARADPARGRLRAFVRVALAHYLGQERRRSQRLKRGGGALVLPLPEGEVAPLADPEARTPDQLLDAEWRAGLLERAAVELEQRCAAEGRPEIHAIFAARLLDAADEPPSYDELALRYGMSRANVSNLLQRAKRDFRAILRELVAETVTDPRELADEYCELFGDPEG